MEFEVDLLFEKLLQFQAGLGSDLFQELTGLADDDAFLGFTFDEDGGEYAVDGGLFNKAVDDHGSGIGQLVVGSENQFFTDDFGRYGTSGLVADLIGGKEHRPLVEVFQ